MEFFNLSFLSSWFTPSSLFLFINLMIGTIYLTARLGSARKHHDDSPGHPHPLARANSSSLIDRVKSINLSLYKFDQPDHPVHDRTRIASAPSLLERLKSFRNSPEPEPEPEPEKAPNPKIMTKSASEKLFNGGVEGGEKEDEIALEKRRPATVRETAEKEKREKAKTASSLEECVDAKADDFINRFKQQLRLQRLDSLKRFSEMIKGK